MLQLTQTANEQLNQQSCWPQLHNIYYYLLKMGTTQK